MMMIMHQINFSLLTSKLSSDGEILPACITIILMYVSMSSRCRGLELRLVSGTEKETVTRQLTRSTVRHIP